MIGLRLSRLLPQSAVPSPLRHVPAALVWALALGLSAPGCDVILQIPDDVEFDDPDASLLQGDAGALDASPSGDAIVVTDAPVGTPIDAPVGTPWWNADYLYRTRITVNVPSLQASLQEVPVLLILNSSRATHIAGTAETGVRVVDDNDNPLEHEIETWDSNGDSYLWVRVPTMTSATPVYLWVYYGGSGAGPQPTPDNVWTSNYVAVWHLQEDVVDGATDGVHNDSTSNGHNGIQRRNEPVVGNGIIGRAQYFDGSDDYIDVAATGGLATGYAQMTILARAQVFSNANNPFQHIVGAGGEDSVGRYRQLYWDRTTAGWTGRYRTDNSVQVLSGQGNYSTWSVVASVYDGGQVRMYLDGQEIGTPENLTGNLAALEDFTIGANPTLDADDGSNRDFDGYIDELRISWQARSEDWLGVQSQSMNDALVSYGVTECLNACP